MGDNQLMNLQLFATAAKGVEPVLARELNLLGAQDVSEEPGGVRFSGNLETVYRANLWLRTANRILVSVTDFKCTSEKDLYEGVRAINWEDYLGKKMTLAVDANVRDSNLKHSRYAALKAKDAIVDQLRERRGFRPDVNPANPDLRINLHIFRNHCTVSLDASGESLHKRGYRVASTEAPLKETLAAAIVEYTGWDMKAPLIDPMCGSGTIVIEAALKAANIAPGLLREGFGFQRWVDFNKRLWNKLVEEARKARNYKLETRIIGYDISDKALQTAKSNAKAAGVDGLIFFRRQHISDLAPPKGPGVIIINPPYGERQGQKEELASLYKTIGDILKNRCKGYVGYIFTGNPDLAKNIGLKSSRRIILYNGPIESRLIRFELY